ncbi:MAG: RHS repeat-associated core domain-containing protein [Deltaproteobacteria bacterium]|nr:RHS repeat-associated core domain-containing protein [Deltaproteobacteria bacterium]
MKNIKTSSQALIFIIWISLLLYPSISFGGANGTLTVNISSNPSTCVVSSISATAVLQSDNTYNLGYPPNACGCVDYTYAYFRIYINNTQRYTHTFYRCCQELNFFPASKTFTVSLSYLSTGHNTIRFELIDRYDTGTVIYKTEERHIYVDQNGRKIDKDSDAISDCIDNCPDAYNPDQANSDGHNFGDACDNCPYVTNPGQGDRDNDGIGDECDCSISLSMDKDKLAPGDTATVSSNAKNLSENITWTISSVKGDAKAKISPSGSTTEATITDVTGEGRLKIRAENPNDPTCYDEEEIEVGCGQCSDCANAGSGDSDLSSIDTQFSVGKTSQGRSAGTIYLAADTIDPINSTPQILKFSSFNNDTLVLYDGATLRQIVAPETFVDIVTINAYKYEIRFLRPDELGSLSNGFYTPVTGAVPFVKWTIENPDSSSTIYNRLRITEDRDGNIKSADYTWDEAQSTWSLSKGNGLQVKTKKEEIINNDRVITETLKDSLENIASKTKTTWHTFPWGDEIIEEVIDPDNASLTTTMTYYDVTGENGYGSIKSQDNPDGSWVRYEYDSTGRKITEISSWLDSPVGTAAGSSRAVSYDYTPQDSSDSNMAEDIRRPRKVTEEIQGIVVSKTYYVYIVDSLTGDKTEIVERAKNPAAGFGAVGNERTITVTYEYGNDTPESGKTKSVTYPDARMDSYTYENGTYTPGANSTPGTFTAGTGEYVKETITHGTTGNPAGVANKTTRDIIITNPVGLELLKETYVYTGTGYERINWSVQTYDEDRHVTELNMSNGTKSSSIWNCCGKESDTDIQGIVKTYTYDDLNRVETETKEAGNDDIYTDYTYDAAGRVLTQIISSGSLELGTTNVYDSAGRIDYATDQAGLLTDYAYTSGGRITTVTRPGGATEITNNYIDGRVKTITGTGVVSKYYTYGVNADSTQWTKINIGSADSLMWEKSTVDMLGRTVSTEKPGPNGTETIQNIYNNLGQLERVITPGQADTIYTYDSLSNQILNGLDVDGNSQLDLASNDRINRAETSFVKISNDWYGEAIQQVYADDLSGNATTVSTRRQRLTGLGTDNLVMENVTIDIHGNQTVSKTYVDRGTKTVTQVTDYPDSTINETTVTVNGLVVSNQSKTGVTVTYGYDPLGRRTDVIDPRTGAATTHYNTLGQVDYWEDAAHNRTSYTYDPATGLKLTETNPANKVTRYRYNTHSKLTHTWGDAVEPVKYVYDDYDRMVEMHTFKGGTGWNGEAWPEATTGTAAITIWHYDPATGLLTSKEYDDGKGVSYTYAAGGKLETRQWARLNNGNPLVTTYGYDPDTGELTSIDYSDNTQDIAFTYDRLGRQKTITDAVGSRTFGYNIQLQQETETITGLYSKVITRTYETAGVTGRATGFNLGAGYTVTYGYEAGTGRFRSGDWSAGGQTGSAVYGYLNNSDLIQQLSINNSLLTTFTYEADRNLTTQVKNEFNSQLISQYDYNYNSLGLREHSDTSGSAFTGTPIEPTPETSTYTTNSLNQYTQITKDNGQVTTDTLTYDDDGNLSSIVTGNNTKLYKYNAENRLTIVEPATPADGDKKVEFVYDYMGRRVQKKVYIYESSAYSLQSIHLFLFDGWNMIQEMDGTGLVQKAYIYGLDLSQSTEGAGGVGGLLSVVDSGEAYLFLYDANGNVGQLLKASDGTISAHYEYDPFGVLLKSYSSKAEDNLFRYSTKYFDTETGLYYYGHRFYSPSLGRWTTRDPIEEVGGLNLYAFVSNNPLRYLDYLGLKEIYGIEIDRQYCGCQKKLKNEIAWAKKMQGIYKGCGEKTKFFSQTPKYKLAKEIEQCVRSALNIQKIETKTAGTTDKAGNTNVIKVSGKCGPLNERGTCIHEQGHSDLRKRLQEEFHVSDLENLNDPATRNYYKKLFSAPSWWQDEYAAYGAEIPFYEAVIKELDDICCSANP